MAVRMAKDGREKPWLAEYRDQDGKRRARVSAPRRRRMPIIGRHWTRSISAFTPQGPAPSRSQTSLMPGLRIAGGATRSETGWRAARSAITHSAWSIRFRAAIGGMKLAALDGLRCQDLINDVASRHQYRHVLVHCCLKLMFRFAVARKWLRRSPLTDEPIRLPLVRKHRVRVANKQELRAVLDAVQDRLPGEHYDSHEIRVAIMLLAPFAGLRRGEIIGLQWDNLDFVNGLIQVRHNYSDTDGLKETKTTTGLRDVPMVPAIRSALIPSASGKDGLGLALP